MTPNPQDPLTWPHRRLLQRARNRAYAVKLRYQAERLRENGTDKARITKLTQALLSVPEPRAKPLAPPRLADTSTVRFAVAHALHIFETDSIYTFIPKNGCSAVRYSIARSNGFVQESDDLRWIHGNNSALVVKDVATLAKPRYSFVILRSPYSRLVSVFFDKFLNREQVATKFANKHLRHVQFDDITFQDFIYRISEINRRKLNHHWKPQVDFLLYRDYDRYFSLESFAEMKAILLRDIGFEVYDTGHLTKHHTSQHRRVVNHTTPWELSIRELRQIRPLGLPQAASMFNKDLAARVAQTYRDDLELYCAKFGDIALN